MIDLKPDKVVLDIVSRKTRGQAVSATKSRLTRLNGMVAFLTHDSDDGKNIPLEKNPEPGNDSQAYIKPNPEESRKENFKETYSGWKFADEDKPKVKKVQKKPIIKTGK